MKEAEGEVITLIAFVLAAYLVGLYFVIFGLQGMIERPKHKPSVVAFLLGLVLVAFGIIVQGGFVPALQFLR